jgi:hypothetical protein
VTFNAFPLFAPVSKPQEAVVGVLRPLRLDKASIRQFAEFFWWEENRDLVGANVLREPTVKEQGDLLIVSFPAALKDSGDFGVRDVIHVFKWELVVNKKTGDVTRKLEKVKEIAGR